MFHRFSRAGRVLGVLCAGLALFSAVWLVREDERLRNQIPKRQAQGRKLRLEHHIATGFHRAAWAGLVVGLAGVSSVWWWGQASLRPISFRAAEIVRWQGPCSVLPGQHCPEPWVQVAAGCPAPGLFITAVRLMPPAASVTLPGCRPPWSG